MHRLVRDLMVRLSNREVAPTVQFTVYILECADSSYYVGVTRKPLEQRLWEHNAGLVDGYTHARRPVQLRCIETFTSALEAISRERQLKGWTRRKKEALIAQRYEDLPALSKNTSSSQTSS